MPFGLTNASATQQRFIEAVLGGLIRKSCFAYIDDILCFSNTFEEHVDHLDEIMSHLESHNLLLQPAKCSFCKPSFEILGYVATKHGLKPSPKKAQGDRICLTAIRPSPEKILKHSLRSSWNFMGPPTVSILCYDDSSEDSSDEDSSSYSISCKSAITKKVSSSNRCCQ